MSERLKNISSLATDSMDSLQSGLETAVNILENSELSRIVDAVDQVYPLPANLKNLSANELAKLGQNRLERYEKERNKGLDKLNNLKDKIGQLFGQVTEVTANDFDSPSLVPIVNKTARDSPLNLPRTQSKTVSAIDLSDGKPACYRPEFKDIYYISATNHFWLVTEKADAKIKQAISEFESRVFQVKDQQQRNQALSELGVLDIMLSMAEESFLQGEQKNEWSWRLKQRQALIEKINSEPNRTVASDRLKLSVWQQIVEGIKLGHGDLTDEMQHPDQKELDTHVSRLRYLKRQAAKEAKKHGYYTDSANDIYDPRQGEIIKIITEYRQAKKSLRHKKTLTTDQVLQQHKETQATIAAYYKKYTQYNNYETDQVLIMLDNRIRQLEVRQQKLLNAVFKLAALGIATPELALSARQNVQEGQSLLARYYQYLNDADQQRALVAQQIEAYLSATGNFVFPPQIFSRNEIEIARLENEANKLKELAEKQAMAFNPPLLMIWELDKYRAQKLDAICRLDFPLREISSAAEASNKKWVNYFSLQSLSKVTRIGDSQRGNQDRASRLAETLPYDIRKLKSGDEALKRLLEIDGIEIIEISRTWFDDKGVLDPDLLFTALKKRGYIIESLTDEAQKQAWGKHLKRFIYSKRVKELFGPLDESPQAQMLRMAAAAESRTLFQFADTSTLRTSSVAKIALQTLVPTAETKDGKAAVDVANVEYQVDLSMARGEISLFDLRFPQGQPEPISVRLKSSRPEVKPFMLHLGGYYARLSAKAWGFIGASLKLGRSVQFVHDGGQLSVSGVDWANKVTDLGDVTAFIGVQAGCSLEGSFHWIPSTLVAESNKQNLNFKPALDMARDQRLGGVTFELSASAGVSTTFPIQLSWATDRLRLTIEPTKMLGMAVVGYSMTVDLGYQAISEWVDLFLDALREAKYGRIQIIKDDETFKLLSDSCQLAVTLGVSVGYVAALGKRTILGLVDAFNRPENAGIVAYSLGIKDGDLNSEPLIEWVRKLPPEALGVLLKTLVSGMKEIEIGGVELSRKNLLTMQQQAIVNIVTWLNQGGCQPQRKLAKPWQRQFEEAVVRMYFFQIHAKKLVQSGIRQSENELRNISVEEMATLDREAKQEAYQQGVTALNDFMALINDNRAISPNKSYKTNRDELLKHLSKKVEGK